MVNNKKSQAAFEYLATYGWAIITALVAVGALAYFGFLNPTNLLPNKCDFGKQMECVEYRIVSDTGEVNLILRNNFGKDINITDAAGDEIIPASPSIIIPAGEKGNLDLTLQAFPSTGEKKEVAMTLTFKRDEQDGIDYPLHNISGTVFVTVQ